MLCKKELQNRYINRKFIKEQKKESFDKSFLEELLQYNHDSLIIKDISYYRWKFYNDKSEIVMLEYNNGKISVNNYNSVISKWYVTNFNISTCKNTLYDIETFINFNKQFLEQNDKIIKSNRLLIENIKSLIGSSNFIHTEYVGWNIKTSTIKVIITINLYLNTKNILLQHNSQEKYVNDIELQDFLNQHKDEINFREIQPKPENLLRILHLPHV